MKKQTISPGCIGIVGLGLIGGSLGLDLQSVGREVHGLVHRTATANQAKKRGLAQVISTDPKILSNCELVIMALPIAQLLEPPSELLEAIPKEAVVTDVGSIKDPIVKVWQKLHPRFIGSHPMAGTTQNGVNAGQRGLFRNRPWVSTPNSHTDKDAIEIIGKLAKQIESNWIKADALEHDKAVALISHLPVLVSAALLKMLGDNPESNIRELAALLASSGFADTTRVGGGNPELGASMASSNTYELLKALDAYKQSLNQLENAINLGKWNLLKEELSKTKLLRENIF